MTIEGLELILPGIDLVNDLDYRRMSWEELHFLRKLEERRGLGVSPAVEVWENMSFREKEVLRDILENRVKHGIERETEN